MLIILASIVLMSVAPSSASDVAIGGGPNSQIALGDGYTFGAPYVNALWVGGTRVVQNGVSLTAEVLGDLGITNTGEAFADWQGTVPYAETTGLYDLTTSHTSHIQVGVRKFNDRPVATDAPFATATIQAQAVGGTTNASFWPEEVYADALIYAQVDLAGSDAEGYAIADGSATSNARLRDIATAPEAYANANGIVDIELTNRIPSTWTLPITTYTQHGDAAATANIYAVAQTLVPPPFFFFDPATNSAAGSNLEITQMYANRGANGDTHGDVTVEGDAYSGAWDSTTLGAHIPTGGILPPNENVYTTASGRLLGEVRVSRAGDAVGIGANDQNVLESSAQHIYDVTTGEFLGSNNYVIASSDVAAQRSFVGAAATDRAHVVVYVDNGGEDGVLAATTRQSGARLADISGQIGSGDDWTGVASGVNLRNPVPAGETKGSTAAIDLTAATTTVGPIPATTSIAFTIDTDGPGITGDMGDEAGSWVGMYDAHVAASPAIGQTTATDLPGYAYMWNFVNGGLIGGFWQTNIDPHDTWYQFQPAGTGSIDAPWLLRWDANGDRYNSVNTGTTQP
jgi:hypothetical protein